MDCEYKVLLLDFEKKASNAHVTNFVREIMILNYGQNH